MSKFYLKSALLRSDEHANIVAMLLQALLQAVQFHLPVRDANFADDKYWQKHSAAMLESAHAAPSADFPAAQVATNAMELRRSITEQRRLRELKQAERAAKELSDRQASAALAEEQAARQLHEREQQLVEKEQRLNAELSRAEQLRQSLQEQATAAAAAASPTEPPPPVTRADSAQQLFHEASAAYAARPPGASVFVDTSVPAPADAPRVAMAAARGRRPRMEDAIAVTTAPLALALFDGHGGPDAAVMCASALPAFLRSALAAHPSDAPTALRRTCTLLQRWLGEYAAPPMAELGTTATILLRDAAADVWHVAQAGDARAVLFELAFAAVDRGTWPGAAPTLDTLRASHARARAELARAADFGTEPRNLGVGGVLLEAQDLAPCHRPAVESEKVRVEARGGAILRGRLCGVLAVTRALGDTAMDPYLSHTPELRGPFQFGSRASGEVEFERRRVLVVACDGAWDILSTEAVAQQLIDAALTEPDAAAPGQSDAESRYIIGDATPAAALPPRHAHDVVVDPLRAAQRVRDAALRGGSSDNVSVIVASLPLAAAPPPAATPPAAEPIVVPAPVAVATPAATIVRQPSNGSATVASTSPPTAEMSKRERRLLAAEAARHRARQQESTSPASSASSSASATPETRRRSRASTATADGASASSVDERAAVLEDLDAARRELLAERDAERQRLLAERAKQRRRASDVRRIVANYAAQKEARLQAEAAALADKEQQRRKRAAATFGAEWDAKTTPAVPVPAAAAQADEPLVLSLSADELTIVQYLRDPVTGVGVQRARDGERLFTGSELVDWLLQHVDSTPPSTPPQSPMRSSWLSPALTAAADDADASNGAMGGVAGVRRADAFAFGQRLLALGVVRIVHDAALSSSSSSSSSSSVPATRELRDTPSITLALCNDFSPTIVLRENPPVEAVDDGNGVVMAFPSRVPRRRPDWLDDACTDMCMQCSAAFRLMVRRHHCRSCGFIVCGKCARRKIALPHLGYAARQLTCERCIAAFYSSGAKVVVKGVVAVAPADEGGRRSRRNTNEAQPDADRR